MKVSQCLGPNAKPAYAPQRIIIDLETEADAIAFRHIVGCWDEQHRCTETKNCKEAARMIRQSIEQGMHLLARSG